MKKLLFILAACVVLTPGVVQAAETIELTPTQVITVDSVSGTVGGMSIQGTYDGVNPTSIQQTYMTFDLSSLGGVDITAASFSIDVLGIGDYRRNTQDPLAFLNHVDYEIMSAGDFDWSNQPSGLIGDDFGDSVNLASTSTAKWDMIASGWDWEYDLSNGYLTLLVAPEYDDYNNSASLADPKLTLTYSVVPAPGSITLAVLGLSSVAAIRRKRRGL